MTSLTRRMILAAERPPGFATIAAFLDKLEGGQIPRDAETLALAKSLEEIFMGAKPATALRLIRKRGIKTAGASATTQQRDWQVCEFIGLRLESAAHRGATTRAYKEAAKKFHRDEKQIQSIWLKGKAEWGRWRALLAPMRRMQRLADEQLRR